MSVPLDSDLMRSFLAVADSGSVTVAAARLFRTQSAVCIDGGQILVITYDQVRQLFFQNPKFGYYFMQISAKRLFDNMRRMQAEIEALRAGRSADAFRPAEP